MQRRDYEKKEDSISNPIFDELTKIKTEIVQIIEGMNSLSLLRDALKKDFDLPGLKQRLQSLPEKIKLSQTQSFNTKNNMGEIESKMKGCEAKVLFEITNEIGTNNKAKFSNENLRKGESLKRLAEDQDYQALRREHSKLQMDFVMAEAETDKLRRDFQGTIALKDLIVAEINLYCK